jgi:hypothetical protein
MGTGSKQKGLIRNAFRKKNLPTGKMGENRKLIRNAVKISTETKK